MVDRVLEQEFWMTGGINHVIPIWQDIAVPESVNMALKPTAGFRDLKPVLELLTEDVLKSSDKDTTLSSDIKRKMCSVLKEGTNQLPYKNAWQRSACLTLAMAGIMLTMTQLIKIIKI